MSFSLFIPQGSTSHNGVPFPLKFTQFRKFTVIAEICVPVSVEVCRVLSRFVDNNADTINFPRSSEQVLRRGICIQYSKFLIDQ